MTDDKNPELIEYGLLWVFVLLYLRHYKHPNTDIERNLQKLLC